MAERMIEANGVELCTEAFGDADDPADRLFPVRHGEALAEEIPGASLLRLESVDPWGPADWQDIVFSVLDHTRGA